MAVAIMMFIKELQRNGGETALTVEKPLQPPKNRHQPQIFFAISRWIMNFWAQFIFFQKIYLNICTKHLW